MSFLWIFMVLFLFSVAFVYAGKNHKSGFNWLQFFLLLFLCRFIYMLFAGG